MEIPSSAWQMPSLGRLLRRPWLARPDERIDGHDRWAELAAYRPHLPDLTLAVGDVIADEYQVEAVLATSILTVTYLVYSTAKRAHLVVKTLRSVYLRDPAAQKAFRRQARVWLGMGSHPYVVRAHALVDVRPRQYLVLDDVAPEPGGSNSLQSYLERERIDLDSACAGRSRSATEWSTPPPRGCASTATSRRPTC